MAYDAICEILGPNGKRLVSIHDFYKGVGKVDLAPGELLTGILIPKESYENCFGYYIKYAMRNAMDIATIGCSVNVVLSADKKTIQRMRISYGVAGPVPMRARSAEAAINGQPVSEATIQLIGTAVLNDVNPRTSWRASADFRKQIISETARRGLRAAVERAGGVFYYGKETREMQHQRQRCRNLCGRTRFVDRHAAQRLSPHLGQKGL